MAKVPGAGQVQRGPSLRDPGVSAPAAAFDLGGAGLVNLGQALADRATVLKATEEKLKEKRQAASDNEFLTKYETEYSLRMAEARQELEQGALEGTVDDLTGQLRSRAEEIDNDLRGELGQTGLIPSVEAMQAATRFSAKTATQALVQGVTFEHNAKVERAVSGINQQLDTLSAKAASDPANYKAYQEEARILVGRLDDLVPFAKREDTIAAAQSNVALSAVQSLARTDPRSTQQRLDEGEFDTFLDGSQKLTVMNMARAELDRRQREAEAAQARALRRAQAEVDDYAALSVLGFKPRVPSLTGVHPEDRARLAADIEVSNAVAGSSLALRGMTPAGRETALADMRQRLEQNPTARNLEIYKGLTTVAESITAAEKDDAFTLDVRWGHVEAWEGEGEPTITNDAYWAYVTENVEGVAQRHPNGMLIPKEAYAEIETALENKDLQGQMVAVRRLATLPGYARAQISSRLEETFGPAVAAVAMLSGVEGKSSIARDVLAGRQMSGPDTLKPTAPVVRQAVTNAYGNAFSGGLTNTGEALVDAGIALYQKRNGVTREELVDTAELERAFRDVVPGSIIERNGMQTYVVGETMETDDVNRAMRQIVPSETDPGAPVRAFGLAFSGGETRPATEVLHANGDPVSWDDILEGTLTPAAPGLFYVATEFGQIMASVDVEGRTVLTPYVLDLRAVLDNAPVAPAMTPGQERTLETLDARTPEDIRRRMESRPGGAGFLQGPRERRSSGSDDLGGGEGEDRLSGAFEPPMEPANGLIPSNIRVFTGTLLGERSTITEADLSESDLGAIKNAVRTVGGSEGVIGYGNYADKWLRDPHGMSVVDLLVDSFSSPAFRMETTLGMARFKKNEKDETIVTDIYDFEATQAQMQEATEQGKLHFLVEAYEKKGPMGFLHALANLSGLGKDGRSRKVRINLGKID